MLLLDATPKHGMLNGIDQPTKCCKPPLSKDINSLPVNIGQENTCYAAAWQTGLGAINAAFASAAASTTAVAVAAMTASHDCIKSRLSISQL